MSQLALHFFANPFFAFQLGGQPLLEMVNLPVWQAILLAIGFPICLLILNETINALERRGNPIARNLRTLRTFVLPVLALLLFVVWILELPSDHSAVRWIETIFWITLLYTLLGVINDIVFGLGGANSWSERVPKLFRDLARFALVAIGAMVIYSKVWGMEVQGAITALGVGSVVIGLVLQEPLGNIISGLMLLLERPLNVGDWVTADGVTGKVVDINWRSVHIETPTREIRIVPNVSLYKSAFSNLSRPTTERTEVVEVGFSYDDPPNRVKQLLEDLLKSTPGIKSNPGPLVRTVNYADFSVIYRMIFTVESQEVLGMIRDQMMTRLWYMARREGLTIPFPIQMEYSPSENPSKPQKSSAEWLRSHPRFEGLANQALATEIQLLEYTVGETIHSPSRQFQQSALILSGQAALALVHSDGTQTLVCNLEPGECIGERLTAGSSNDSIIVRAVSDLVLLRMPSEKLDGLINRSSSLASEIGDSIEARRQVVLAAKRLHQSQSK